MPGGAAGGRPFGAVLRSLAAVAAGLALLGSLAGAAYAAPPDGGEAGLFHLGPENIGTYGDDIDRLYAIIIWLTTITFVLTEGALLFFVLKFRAKPGGKAVFTHGNHSLELVWTILPGVILFALAIIQMGIWKEIKITRPDTKQGLVVEVMAKQFEWHFRYAGPD